MTNDIDFSDDEPDDNRGQTLETSNEHRAYEGIMAVIESHFIDADHDGELSMMEIATFSSEINSVLDEHDVDDEHRPEVVEHAARSVFFDAAADAAEDLGELGW